MIKTEATSKKDISEKDIDIALYMLGNNVKVEGSKEDEAIAPSGPVAEEDEEYQGGAFSKQKGGSAALSLDAYIAAMNAQIEAVNLRRERAQSMIEMDVMSTQLASDNVIKMGQAERNGYFAQGIASIAGGAVSLGGVGYSAYKANSINTGTKAQAAEIDNLDTAIRGLDHLEKAAKGNPYATVMVQGGDGRMTPGPRSAALNQTIREMSTVDKPIKPVIQDAAVIDKRARTTRAADADLVDSKDLMKLNQMEYDAMKHMTQPERDAFRKHLTSQRERNQSILNNAEGQKSMILQSVRMGTEAFSGIASGIGSMVHGKYSAERSAYESDKMLNELSARYASQELQLNNENASQREGDIYATIRTLSQLTQADIRG